MALEVDTSVYSREALLRAAYKFTNRCYVFLAEHRERPLALLAVLAMKSREEDIEPTIGEFANELLDQRLRESLEQQFGAIRTLIVAQAFAEGNLLDPARDDGDYEEDPLRIGERR